MKIPCTLKNALLIIRDHFGLSFASKGLGYLAALLLILSLLARYKLSCYQTTLQLTISALADITLPKLLVISFCSSLGLTLLLIEKSYNWPPILVGHQPLLLLWSWWKSEFLYSFVIKQSFRKWPVGLFEKLCFGQGWFNIASRLNCGPPNWGGGFPLRRWLLFCVLVLATKSNPVSFCLRLPLLPGYALTYFAVVLYHCRSSSLCWTYPHQSQGP